MKLCDDLAKEISALVHAFGAALEEFFANLLLDRAMFWEDELFTFLTVWKARGIKVDGPSHERLRGVIRELRAELVPNAQYPLGVYKLAGQHKAREFAKRWTRVGPTGTSFGPSDAKPVENAPPAQGGKEDAPAPSAELAQAPMGASGDAKPQPAKRPAEAAPDDDGGVAGRPDDLHWIPFDRHMESEGILYYQARGQWWKVPIRMVTWEGEEVYDLRGAARFTPTFLQNMILGADGVLDDQGFEIIIRHYIERYGLSGSDQLIKDLASENVGTAFKKFAVAQGPQLLLGLLAGEVLERIARIAKPALNKAFAAIDNRLRALMKNAGKQGREALEKELGEIVADVRKIAADSATDAESKQAVRKLADEIEQKYKQGSKTFAGHVITYDNEAAARSALPGKQGVAANRFFRRSTGKSTDYKITELEGGGKRLEYFSPANTPGYGKLFIQEIDADGVAIREYRQTIGPAGGVLKETYSRGGPPK